MIGLLWVEQLKVIVPHASVVDEEKLKLGLCQVRYKVCFQRAHFKSCR